MPGVYQIQAGDGKRYIGSSVNPYKRWKEHRHHLRKGKHHSKYLQNVFNKHGEDWLKFSILESCELRELRVKEQWWLDTARPELNMTNDVTAPIRGRKLSPETRARIAENNRKLWSNPQLRERWVATRREVAKDPKFRERASRKSKERWQDDDFRLRCSKASKKRWDNPELAARMRRGRPVDQIDLETGIVLNTYPSVLACVQAGFHVRATLRGPSTCGSGFGWAYAN